MHTGCDNIIIQGRDKGVLIIVTAVHKPAAYERLDGNRILSKIKRRHFERRHCQCVISG